jgi:hypothetical protein
MTWLSHHSESEKLAAQAETETKIGNAIQAIRLYAKAAREEQEALKELSLDKIRTLGISTVSAVSLCFKAQLLDEAELIACKYLTLPNLPLFSKEELRVLLNSIWSEKVRERANVGFVPGQVLVSVKGGEVVEGGAPLDLIVEKVQTVQSIFYRTAELLKGIAHRTHGGPSKEIQDLCRPWLFQAAPGSYQFAIAVQEPKQPDFFKKEDIKPNEVANNFLKIMRTSVETPDELSKIVPDAAYRGTFLKLTRNLAPTGKRFEQLDIKAAGESKSFSLVPSTRKLVGKIIQESRDINIEKKGKEETLRGVLRAVHLDNDWIEITTESEKEQIKITGITDTVDDVIGPMVNHFVLARVEKTTAGKYIFLDIELEE